MRQILRLIWTLLPPFSDISYGKKQPVVTHMPLCCAVLVSLCFVLFSSNPIQAQATPLTIDSFETDQGPLNLEVPAGVGGTDSSTVSGAGILGGERDILIKLINGTTNFNDLNVGVSTGTFFYGQDPTLEGSTRIEWDGPDGDPTTLDPIGLGGEDLTVGGTQDAFLFRINSDDLPTNPIIEVFTDAGNSSTFTLSLPGSIFLPGEDYVIPFDAFTPNLGTGANFESVGAITLFITSSADLDLVIDSFSTMPLVIATKADILFEDNDGNDQANPGDTLRYTITITNPDDASDDPATNVIFTDTPDPNTTLVVGSVTVTPPLTLPQGVTSGNGPDDTRVEVDIGDIAEGASVTITFDVTINDPLPEGTTQVANQGFVSTNETLTNVPTNETITRVVVPPPPAPTPTSIPEEDDFVPAPAPPPGGAAGGGGSPSVTPQPGFPTTLPETGELSANRWTLIVAGLILVVGVGVLLRIRK